MGIIEWIIVGLLLLLLILACVGAVLGFGFNVLWLFTAIFHAFKEEPPTTPADTDWSQDQAEESFLPDVLAGAQPPRVCPHGQGAV